MTTDTIVREPPSFGRTWRMNWNLRYDVTMSSIIIILSVAAILHLIMGTHKIPLDGMVFGLSLGFGSSLYPVSIIFTVTYWLQVLECEDECEDESLLYATYTWGRLTHTLGFCIFLCLLYFISPLALYIGLPGLLWFIPAMIAPFCPGLWRGEPAWWNFVKKPQSRVAIV